MTDGEKATRRAARSKIILLANIHREYNHPGRKSFTARHIQRAVSVCRSNRLVDTETLIAAGFRG